MSSLFGLGKKKASPEALVTKLTESLRALNEADGDEARAAVRPRPRRPVSQRR